MQASFFFLGNRYDFTHRHWPWMLISVLAFIFSPGCLCIVLFYSYAWLCLLYTFYLQDHTWWHEQPENNLKFIVTNLRRCLIHLASLESIYYYKHMRLFCKPEDLRIPFERFGPVKDVYLPKNFYIGYTSFFEHHSLCHFRLLEDHPCDHLCFSFSVFSLVSLESLFYIVMKILQLANIFA